MKMKKFTAIILSVLMIMTSLAPLSAFAESEVVRAFPNDSNPISLKEVNDAIYTPVFYLAHSDIDYSFSVVMPDGSVQPLGTEDEVSQTRTAGSKYINTGYAYVDFEECAEAQKNKETTVPVHVFVTVSEKNETTGRYEKLRDFDVIVEKILVPSYIKSITPIENAPEYIYEDSEAAHFDETVFLIEYWNDTSKTLKPVRTSVDDVPHYTLDGKALIYGVNHDNSKIYVSYMDSSCICDNVWLKEFPFSSVEFLDCTLSGDMPTNLTYRIHYKDGTSKHFIKDVTTYSGYIDYIDGYAVTFSTEGSQYTSTVQVTVGGKISDSETYELQQQSFLQRLIAKLVWFIKQIFAAGIF